jgi:cell division protein YceG involved in septum cleavage
MMGVFLSKGKIKISFVLNKVEINYNLYKTKGIPSNNICALNLVRTK